ALRPRMNIPRALEDGPIAEYLPVVFGAKQKDAGLRESLCHGNDFPVISVIIEPMGSLMNWKKLPFAPISAIAGGPSTSLRSGVPEIIGCIRPRISLRDQAAVDLNCSTGDVRRGVRA